MKALSVVIRALNEEASLQKLFHLLKNQRYDGEVQLIVVDNESHDRSVSVAQSFGAKVIHLARNEFSYPRSMNIGIQAAKSEIVVLMVAHAYPFEDTWLSAGAGHFSDPAVAGVFANVIPCEGATQQELDFYMPNYEEAKRRGPFAVGQGSMGIMGATNCIVRRSLWEVHPFNEQYGLGGEDGEWAQWAMSKGYKIINDYHFSVRHSHSFKDGGLEKQVEYWKSLSEPQPFDKKRLDFSQKIYLLTEIKSGGAGRPVYLQAWRPLVVDSSSLRLP
jgi:glycosyltransferase involved in cell wall biosynthesis